MKSERLHRRHLLMAAIGASTVGDALAQQPGEQSPDDLAVARRSVANNLKTLAKVELPMSAEPAFQFKA